MIYLALKRRMWASALVGCTTVHLCCIRDNLPDCISFRETQQCVIKAGPTICHRVLATERHTKVIKAGPTHLIRLHR